MGLFAFDAEYVGPGLALWLPKGGVLVEELEKLAKETEFQAGYVRVRTPVIAPSPWWASAPRSWATSPSPAPLTPWPGC